MKSTRLFVSSLLFAASSVCAQTPAPKHDADITAWTPNPADWKGATVGDGKAVLTGDKWSFLRSPSEHPTAELSTTVTIDEAAKGMRFFGESWSVWPDGSFGDGGFEAALLLRAGMDGGYRVQLSHKYQAVALVKWPEGGYVRVVPCVVKLKEPHQIRVRVQGSLVTVSVDGAEKLRWDDYFLPLEKGGVGLGVSSGARVTFSDVTVTPLPASPATVRLPHAPNFSVRKFLGVRPWVFDGDEPILLLPVPEANGINNVKLRPGYKPQLSWNSHWDVQNQGAYKEAMNTNDPATWSGGGANVTATWTTKHTQGAFGTTTTLLVGWDEKRQVYTYDVSSVMDVARDFHFRYGFDFEHHTPLDPFRWQYLVFKRAGGEWNHRPVYPIDPGPQYDLETYGGARVWFGRHLEKMHIAPAVEYDITGSVGRKMNTAVCAAFYDTGVSFPAETVKAGTRVEVKYRYTGYPADEAEKLFRQSKIYDAPTLDPKHHYIFADEWPKLTFSQFVPMSETWIYGRRPFMTAHNTRPTYELEKNCGAGSGFAMKLGPASFGKASLPVPAPLANGRYLVTALVKSVNAHGPGGRIEIEATQAKTNKKLAEARHFVGNGTFDWKQQGFVFEIPEEAAGLSVAFGNAGTGEMLVTGVEFRKLNDGEEPPAGIAGRPNDRPPAGGTAPAGAIADYRMEEGRGHFVLNNAGGGHLDLANVDWVTDAGRPAIRFAENAIGRKDYRRDSSLARNYFAHSAYAGKDSLPVALSGLHGGGAGLKGLTLAAWIKPAPEMGVSSHGGKGDVIGYGARRFILSLRGQKAPYQLSARINVNDTFNSETKLEAERWSHVAMTAEPVNGQWRVRLFVDGKAAGEGMTAKFPADSVIPNSLILGAEIFYFHDAYYRGLIGHTLVFDRSLAAEEIAALAK